MSDKLYRFRQNPEALAKYNQAVALLLEADVDEIMNEELTRLAREVPLGEPHVGAQHAALMAGFAMATSMLFNLLDPSEKTKLPKPSWGGTGPRRLKDATV